MSGGSYSYMFTKAAGDLYDEYTQEQLDNMASRFIELGYIDVGKEVLNLLYTVKQTKIRIEVMQERLSEVLKALEWYDSSDIRAETLREAIDEYRGEKQV